MKKSIHIRCVIVWSLRVNTTARIPPPLATWVSRCPLGKTWFRGVGNVHVLNLGVLLSNLY